LSSWTTFRHASAHECGGSARTLVLPEALISGREEIWLRYIFSSWCYNPQLFSAEEIAEYVRAYSQPGALRRAFNNRAGPEDVVQDEEDKGVLIECPTLVLWGEEFAIGGKMWDFRSNCKEMARDPSFFSLPRCGHLPDEAKSQETPRCSSFSKSDKTEDPTKQPNAGVNARIPLTEYRVEWLARLVRLVGVDGDALGRFEGPVIFERYGY
jgi:hypothetical protein